MYGYILIELHLRAEKTRIDVVPPVKRLMEPPSMSMNSICLFLYSFLREMNKHLRDERDMIRQVCAGFHLFLFSKHLRSKQKRL